MNICIRTDASFNIGTGHLMRCLTLAQYLQKEGAEVYFICRDHPGIEYNAIIEKGFELILLEYSTSGAANVDHEDQYKRWLAYPPEVDRDQTLAAIAQLEKPIDLLIIDHYGLDTNWERELRRAADKIMVIDDLANRRHDCDILLDRNCHINMESRYNGLIPDTCLKLLGPKYAMLREEFSQARETLRERSGDIKNLIIFYGETDPTGETLKALNAIDSVGEDRFRVRVIAGRNNPLFDEISDYCKDREYTEHIERTDRMAELLAEADLALGSGGNMTWERCALALPSLITAIVENQEPVSRLAETYGFGIYMRRADDVTEEKIAEKLKMLLANPVVVRDISKRAGDLVDARGTSRVVEAIFEVCNTAKPESLPTADDSGENER